MSIENIRQILSQREACHIPHADMTPSAVLVPIYENSGELHMLFTKRTERVDSHKGQISFPGGRCEQGETAQATALRESWEEIGLRSVDVRILGELDDTITVFTNYVITPFVGAIPYPYQFQINTQEVDRIITVPMAALLDKGNCTEDTQIYQGEAILVCTYTYGKDVIWGATARILKHFLDLVYGD